MGRRSESSLFFGTTFDLYSPGAIHKLRMRTRGRSSSSLLVGCKHRASEVLLYIGGRGLVSQIIEPVTFARCAFIIALRNIALDGYLDTRRNIWNIYGTTYGLKYIYRKIRAIEQTRKLASLAISLAYLTPPSKIRNGSGAEDKRLEQHLLKQVTVQQFR